MCTSQSLFLPTYSYGFGRGGAHPGDDGIKPIDYQVDGCLKFTMLCLICFVFFTNCTVPYYLSLALQRHCFITKLCTYVVVHRKKIYN